MDGSAFGADGYTMVPPPAAGFWRVSTWHAPFDPPAAAPPLGSDAKDDDGHRYDDPEGHDKTLYCTTEPDGAIGECLGDFVYSAVAAQRIEAFLESAPDDESDEDLQRPLTEEDIERFGWKLAHAPGLESARMINVDDWRSYLAAAPKAIPALAAYGIRRFDRRTLLDERRYVTRTMAGVWRDDATDTVTGDRFAAGLRFTSRLAPAWECWALWEPLAIDEKGIGIEEVTIHTPALRRAADMLGVGLAFP
jgi:hypothetical protein